MQSRMTQNCFIFGAGVYDAAADGSLLPLPVFPAPGDLVIAADGGLSAVRRLGIKPKLIIGDFDSLGHVPEAACGEELLQLPVEKDDTDMRAAMREGMSRGCSVFHLYGGMGGRIDHTLANIQCLAWLAANGCRGYLFGGGNALTAIRNERFAIPKGLPFSLRRGTLSLFAQGGDAHGVTVAGLAYTLQNAVLYRDIPLGVSNEYRGGNAEITVADGTLLAVLPMEIQ